MRIAPNWSRFFFWGDVRTWATKRYAPPDCLADRSMLVAASAGPQALLTDCGPVSDFRGEKERTDPPKAGSLADSNHHARTLNRNSSARRLGVILLARFGALRLASKLILSGHRGEAVRAGKDLFVKSVVRYRLGVNVLQ